MTIENAEETMSREYADFVKRHFKIPEGEHAGIMHAAVGVAGEAQEFHDADERANIIEESGDLEFYLEAAWQQIPPNFQAERGHRTNTPISFISFGATSTHIFRYAGGLIDEVKKGWVYNKPMDFGSICIWLNLITQTLDTHYEMIGMTREEIIAANMAKLKARYHEGRYTDEAAQVRADKLDYTLRGDNGE